MFCYVCDSLCTDYVGLAQVKNFELFRHALARTGCPYGRAGAWCFALGRWPTLQATLPRSVASYARHREKPGQRPGFTRVQSTAVLRLRLRRLLFVACRQWALAARLCCRRCAVPFARFFADSLAIPPEVCPSPARPARGVHKAASHSLHSCLQHLYKPSPLIPGMPVAAVLRARNSAKNGELESQAPPETKIC